MAPSTATFSRVHGEVGGGCGRHPLRFSPGANPVPGLPRDWAPVPPSPPPGAAAETAAAGREDAATWADAVRVGPGACGSFASTRALGGRDGLRAVALGVAPCCPLSPATQRDTAQAAARGGPDALASASVAVWSLVCRVWT